MLKDSRYTYILSVVQCVACVQSCVCVCGLCYDDLLLDAQFVSLDMHKQCDEDEGRRPKYTTDILNKHFQQTH